MDLRLRPFTVADEHAAREAHAEMAEDDFTFLLDWSAQEPWSVYLERLEAIRHGRVLAPGWVPSTLLAADVRGELVGRVSVRHRLNDFLASFGGRIGYDVLSRYRRRGYATEILRQALIIARAEGVERALVTCDEDNAGSATVIERLGGTSRTPVPTRPECARAQSGPATFALLAKELTTPLLILLTRLGEPKVQRMEIARKRVRLVVSLDPQPEAVRPVRHRPRRDTP